METKQLAIQSFERGQSILERLNKLLIHLKLSQKGISDQQSAEEIKLAKATVKAFLSKLSTLVSSNEQDASALTGVDGRYRTLVHKFAEAKNRSSRYRSALFRKDPNIVLTMLDAPDGDDASKLIESLTEFRSLLEDHLSSDTRELIGEL
ncbi:hypothetical protein [Arcticibacter tournemirensis]|uniref:Uncharacterized protein n=1 Tax=Arcticibacter tournemirensis TaxID=699437 RepID=A0A4Q0M4T1_9SPHI|nr:hypothetical protein [Arcticibacter tournemirensis]RXF67729.1 hypothetical protein EKH83_18040 [Arcticibacter tournemirensis]